MIVLLTSLLAHVAPMAAGPVIHVPADAATIQAAIHMSNPFDTIVIAPGIYDEMIDIGHRAVTLQSSNPTDPQVVETTVINCLVALGTTVNLGTEDDTVLDGLTITGVGNGFGVTGGSAGGKTAVQAIRRCVVRGNGTLGQQVDYAGVAYFSGTIEDCQIVDNLGHGLAYLENATVRRTVIRNNMITGITGSDSGIFSSGTVTDCRIERSGLYAVDRFQGPIRRCVIASNGAGVEVHHGELDQCYIIGNQGAGIIRGSGYARNCVIAGNRGSGVNGSSKNILNCTVTQNVGNGIRAVQLGALIHSCILTYNEAGDVSGDGQPVGSTVGGNPLFVSLGHWDPVNLEWVGWDYHLTQDSPSIDAPGAGGYPGFPDEDLDGNPRIARVGPDTGAFEFPDECDGPDFDNDETPDQCDGDIDNDGIVNVEDVCDFTPPGILVDPQGRPYADLNLDCTVDLLDHAIFQTSMFGP